MPGLLLHVNAVMQCTHGAKATVAPSQPRVVVSGGCDRASAKDFHEIRAVFTRGVA